MKSFYRVFLLLCINQFVNAQTQPEFNDRLFLDGNSIIKEVASNNWSINILIGGQLESKATANINYPIGYPFGKKYFSDTFVEDMFKVSKGYYTDHVKLEWVIGANIEQINNFQLLRREVGSSAAFSVIASDINKDSREYLDYQVATGVIYEYKLKVPGLYEDAGEIIYANMVSGIGFKNPTANVTGRVSYEGGTPVQNVIVRASSVGDNKIDTGSSVDVSSGYLAIENFTNEISMDNITFQSWNAGNGTIFEVKESSFSLNLKLKGGVDTANNKITFKLEMNNNGTQTTLKELELSGSYPTGEIDDVGKDEFKNINTLSKNSFIHTTLVLEKDSIPKIYLNGRKLTSTYISNAATLNADNSSVSSPNLIHTPENDIAYTLNESNSLSELRIGENFIGHLDEVRFWERAISDSEIKNDFRRYLSGTENSLVSYLRMNEGYGTAVYDISKSDIFFNQNHAYFKSNLDEEGPSFETTVVPSTDQLGVFGVTDQSGGYLIASIPFSGTGETFLVSPSLGNHSFQPASQTLFLGVNEPVVNRVDFTDISSFLFSGKVIYNVQNVFEATDPSETYSNVFDYGYNQYQVTNSENQTITIDKGAYYNEPNSSGAFSIKQYPVIPVEKANVYIDGVQQLNDDNTVVETDANGHFQVRVPIGKHRVEVRKEGHSFIHNGFYPASGTANFYQDNLNRKVFIDSTRVSLVGRVVGGNIESSKPIGFGQDSTYIHKNFEGTTNGLNERISSLNNIGQAAITLTAGDQSFDPKKTFLTNQETGEYRVSLIPINYSILASDGVKINSNTDLDNKIILATEVLDLSDLTEPISETFTTVDGQELTSEPYHMKKSFIYYSPIKLGFISQEEDLAVVLNGESYTLDTASTPFENTAFYTQNNFYTVKMDIVQSYKNYDDNATDPSITKEYFSDGTFIITNNLEISGNYQKPVLSDDNTHYIYRFRAGDPNSFYDSKFSKTLQIQYQTDPSNVLSLNGAFKKDGVILGKVEPQNVNFITIPQTPDIILRDPPGSNSFASIQKGTSIQFDQTFSDSFSNSNSSSLFVSAIPSIEFSSGAGFFSINTNIEPVVTGEEDITTQTTKTNSRTNSVNYTFNTTISTSDDPGMVGANADLYIGTSTNFLIGEAKNISFHTEDRTVPGGTSTFSQSYAIPIVEGNGAKLYLREETTEFFGVQPGGTTFMYTQDYILNTLIPDFEQKAITPPTPSDEMDGSTAATAYKSGDYYSNAAKNWKKIIQDNERAKYLAINQRDAYLSSVTSTFDGVGANQSALDNLVNQHSFKNLSFDAGLGSYEDSFTTLQIEENSLETEVGISVEFESEFGLFINNYGASVKFNQTTNSTDLSSTNAINENLTTISYTLRDNDDHNVLSVDVVNMFDGNGPIFITEAGATSCPYEGATTSVYYNNDTYISGADEQVGSGGELLSVATKQIYKSNITVTESILTEVAETDQAQFELKLLNQSETESDLEFILEVEQQDLGGGTSNIGEGVSIILPYGQEVPYTFTFDKPTGSASSDVYEYNFKVFLRNPCTDLIDVKESEKLDLSVFFVKSCSNVSLSSPDDNWRFNRNAAYAVSSDGTITTQKLPIILEDFNTDFSGFNKIELYYKNINSSNWTLLKTYEKAAITDTQITYNWDIVTDNIADGSYQLKAVSYCGTASSPPVITYESNILSGVVNLNPPLLFGTPEPSDGILGVGEDISLRFNEDISYAGLTSQITVSGLQNQQDVNHSVFVSLDGASNTIELPNQVLPDDSFTFQFWYKNLATSNGTGNLVSQVDGINIDLIQNSGGKQITFNLGGKSASADISPTPGSYNFYSFVYIKGTDNVAHELRVYMNGNLIVQKKFDSIAFNANKSIIVGGNNVKGNIHDIRFWSKGFSVTEANIAKDLTLSGNEIDLLGYWALDEGHGTTGLDKAKSRNAILNSTWGITPSGNAYSFSGNSYLKLDQVGRVQPTDLEDITLSFWVKTTLSVISNNNGGTIFSNGRGDDQEAVLTNGFRNKWSVNMKSDGNLELSAENQTYNLTESSIADGLWHHVAIVLKRGTSLNTFIDGLEVSSLSSLNIGGISGVPFIIGARYFEANGQTTTIDNHFTGALDEFRLWNTARDVEQIKRDRYFELDTNLEGLMLYMDFNDNSNNTSAPRYSHLGGTNSIISTSLLPTVSSTLNYTVNAPPIKPKLTFTNITANHVINGDELIIEPLLTDEEWLLFEGQILDFSVSKLTDEHANQMVSPVNWSAYVNKKEIEWFTENQSKQIDAEKYINDPYSFTMTVSNIGASIQSFSILGLPSWISVNASSGTVSPNSTQDIVFQVDSDLVMGIYDTDIYLKTDSGYNDRLNLKLRVLTQEPDWSVNQTDYSSSMNIIGKLKIKETFSRDRYSKIGAFVDDKPRGEAYLQYNEFYDSYFVYLTVYSNSENVSNLEFKIWDAKNGKVLIATVDDQPQIPFINNQVLGSLSSPVIFKGDNFIEQQLSLNDGWTWVSLFVKDERFGDLKTLFQDITLSHGDQIKTLNSELDVNDLDGDGDTSDYIGEVLSKTYDATLDLWYGQIETISNNKMYKLKLANSNQLKLKGNDVDETNIQLNIAEGWNWLSYPIYRNISLEEALSFYSPSTGDVIKDQFSFAIYDQFSGWNGTLNYMKSNTGYMLKSTSSTSQTLNYPLVNEQSRFNEEYLENVSENNALFSKYNANMNLVVEIKSGEELTKLLVYDSDNVLRGESPIVLIGDKKYSFLTAFSNSQEELKFSVTNNSGEIATKYRFVFENNKVLGNLETPYILDLTGLYTNNLKLESVYIYPNPFSNKVRITSTLESEVILKIELTTPSGTLVQSMNTNSDTAELDTVNLKSGLYLIRITYKSGKSIVRKIIKK